MHVTDKQTDIHVGSEHYTKILNSVLWPHRDNFNKKLLFWGKSILKIVFRKTSFNNFWLIFICENWTCSATLPSLKYKKNYFSISWSHLKFFFFIYLFTKCQKLNSKYNFFSFVNMKNSDLNFFSIFRKRCQTLLLKEKWQHPFWIFIHVLCSIFNFTKKYSDRWLI